MSHILDTNAKQKCMTNSTRLLSKGLLGVDPMMGSDSMMWDAKACRSSLTFIVGMMMRNDYDDDDDNRCCDENPYRCIMYSSTYVPYTVRS
jgi:hypothetical protein